MQVFRFPEKIRSLFRQERAVFWFSSQELLFWWEKKKKRISLAENSGFSGGQVADVDAATATIARVCEQEGLPAHSFFSVRKATVFIPTESSPLERRVIRRVFQTAGFQKISLVAYTTAIRAFAQRQAIRSGVGIYVGSDVSEGIVFSSKDQQLFSLSHSLSAASTECQRLLREAQQLEVSAETAGKLYAALGKKKEKTAYPIRGRNIQTNQVETRSLTAKDCIALADFFEKKFDQELAPLTASSLFETISPDRWVIIGDELLKTHVQETYTAETVFLSSEQEMIQGVQWL